MASKNKVQNRIFVIVKKLLFKYQCLTCVYVVNAIRKGIVETCGVWTYCACGQGSHGCGLLGSGCGDWLLGSGDWLLGSGCGDRLLGSGDRLLGSGCWQDCCCKITLA